MNQVVIDGVINRKVDVRFTASGKKVVSGSLEWSKPIKDKMKKGWFKWQAWGPQADQMEYVPMGARVMFVAELETNSWEDKEGKKVYETRLNVLQMSELKMPEVQTQMMDDEDLPF